MKTKKIKNEYNIKRTNITLYKELLNLLQDTNVQDNKMFASILLNTIYGNNIYVDELCNILYNSNYQQGLSNFIAKILNEYNKLKNVTYQLKKRIDRNYDMVQTAYRVRKSLSIKAKILDSKNDIFNLKKIINYYNMAGVISNKEEILLLNEIELYNRKIASKYGAKEEQEYTEQLYNELPNILNIGFQELDEVEVALERKTTLDSFVKEIKNLTSVIDKEQIIELFEMYKKYNLEDREYNYIILQILQDFLEELLTIYVLLLDKEYNSKRRQRIELIKDYYNLLEKYSIIMNYYNEITEYVSEELFEVDESLQIQSEERRLIYSRSTQNITNAKILSDMRNFPYENYEKIEQLIFQFKEGSLGSKKIKTIHKGNKSDGHIELKDDDIRIVLRRVKENIYCVLGVFIKKANNDTNTYRIMTNRMTPDISSDEKLSMQLELSKYTEEELSKLVKEKSRKNGR